MAPADFPEPAQENVERDLFWMRPLTPSEQGMRYVHAYDKSSMYLAACSSMPLGFGKPELVTGGMERFSPKTPGYWHVIVPSGSAHAEFPAIAPQAPWCATPSLSIALEAGYRVTFQEAWVWPEAHQPLNPWSKHIRTARDVLRGSSPLAYRALKSCYTQSIGWLGLRTLADSEMPNDLYRPDWRHAIIAAARANLYRNIVKAYKASGRAPFAVGTDCLYYTADDFAETFAQEGALGLRMGDAPGEYKVKNGNVLLRDVWDCIEQGGTRGLRLLQMRLNGTEGASEDAT
jgi:hypothetical protein